MLSVAKLSFAFTCLTNNAVTRQFSTFLLHASRSYFAPLKKRLDKLFHPVKLYRHKYSKPYRHVASTYLPLVLRGSSLSCPSNSSFSTLISFWWRRRVLHPRPVRFSIRIIELYIIYTISKRFCQSSFSRNSSFFTFKIYSLYMDVLSY